MSIRLYTNLSEVDNNKQIKPEKFGSSRLMVCCVECDSELEFQQIGIMVPKYKPFEEQVCVDSRSPCKEHPNAGFYIIRVLDVHP